MYLMQEVGEPLKLRYKQAYYGPFAENLGHVLKAVEGHLISGYADGGDTPDKPLKLVPGAHEEAKQVLEMKETHGRVLPRLPSLSEDSNHLRGSSFLNDSHWNRKE